MRIAGVASIVCLVGQAAAYNNSLMTAGKATMQCTVHPFGQCETVMASGYAVLMQGAGASHNFEAAVATFVPLMMWLTLLLSAHSPRLTMKRDGKKTISPGGWMYLGLFAIVLVVSGLTIREKDPPKRGGADAPALG
jgi:hypothetical protein